jgi:hypothetical protein
VSSTTLIPMFDPEGTLRSIPQDQVRDAMAAGGKVGVKMTDPAGKTRMIPHDQFQDAIKAGGKVIPIEQQATPHPGFWSTLGSDLGDMAKGLLTPAGVSPGGYPSAQYLGGKFVDNPALDPKQIQAQQGAEDESRRKAAGYGSAYRTTAAIAQPLGVNASGMEQSAAQGDTSGVLAHATSSAVPYGVGAAVSHVLSRPAPPPGAEGAVAATEIPKGNLIQRGARSLIGASDKLTKDIANEAVTTHAEKVGTIDAKNAEAAATQQAKVAKVQQREQLQQQSLDNSAALAQRVQQVKQAVRNEGTQKYNVVTQAVGDAGVPANDIASLVNHAQENILKGSRPESIKQFRSLLTMGEPSNVSTSVGVATPGTALYDALVSEGAISPRWVSPVPRHAGIRLRTRRQNVWPRCPR